MRGGADQGQEKDRSTAMSEWKQKITYYASMHSTKPHT